ncbi:hypothetical protein KBY84_12720 [Cyanobium sp. N.Huapi 1H5]|uniref:hypothetical protein n=1 Tax=Cyanobium sp. N.Huapi 1H5 TaxID=2823719 RepID=UPI0020CCAF53|nr:hypothetical protein [Cyanobium sp. N.Huapi 1H5]MCP9838357.1 hypothetical protein [Cyanobium sp. N.Huapi 1H5]
MIDHPIARHFPDDDTPRQPECSPLDSAQHRRAMRQGCLTIGPAEIKALRPWLRS